MSTKESGKSKRFVVLVPRLVGHIFQHSPESTKLGSDSEGPIASTENKTLPPPIYAASPRAQAPKPIPPETEFYIRDVAHKTATEVIKKGFNMDDYKSGLWSDDYATKSSQSPVKPWTVLC